MVEKALYSLVDHLGNPRHGSSREFGITEPTLASTVVYDVTSHLFDAPARCQPTWMTADTDAGATGIHWLIGPNGKASRIGIFWEHQDPIVLYGEGIYSYAFENQSLYGGTFSAVQGDGGKVVAVRQLVHNDVQISRFLCVQMPHVDWEEISRFVLTNALVSGVGHVGGPIRDFITQYKKSDPPLLQELKQR